MTILSVLTAICVIVGFVGHFVYLAPMGTPAYYRLRLIAHMELETVASHVLFLLSTLLLFTISLHHGSPKDNRVRRYWWTLTALFCFMFLVRVLPIYSDALEALRRLDPPRGWKTSTTIQLALGIGAALGFGWYFLKFLPMLPPRIRYAFVVGGVLFVMGELGMEGVSEWCWSHYSSGSIPYAVADVSEETLESIGLIVFVNALLIHLGTLRAAVIPAGVADDFS